MSIEKIERTFDAGPGVRGFLHRPRIEPVLGLVLTHGAGSNCEAPLIAGVARALAELGLMVLRCDLPFRQERPKGPPRPAASERDREGLRRAAVVLREFMRGEIWIGGQSYGGRQASMLAASDAAVCSGLLLLSYPLHPPGKPEQPRTTHLPAISVPALFVHGTSDPFGSPDEIRAAAALVHARTWVHLIDGVGHDLGGKRNAQEAAEAFAVFTGIMPAEAVEIPITDVFDLHSVPPRDVEGAVEAYLEQARERGFTAVRIVHGRGIGVQREIVRSVLARTPFVARFSDAPEGAGGWGATVVELRQPC